MFKLPKLLRNKIGFLRSDSWPSDELLSSIIRRSEAYAVLWLSKEGNILWANAGALQILKYKESELYGRKVSELFTPDDVAQNIPFAELERALKEGKAEDERWHVRQTGERFWATGVMTYIPHKEEARSGFCKVFRDITARKLTEDEIRIANANLRSFSQTAAHDLQAPLKTISLTLQLVLRSHRDSLSAEIRKHFESVSNAAKHLSALIKSILVHSEVGMKEDKFKNSDMNSIFDMAVSNLRPLIEEHNAAITKGRLPEVFGVPEELERLFQNLITNAIKYRSNERPKLHVDAEPSDDRWLFSAKDNGIGIGPEHHERIFESFQRVHTAEDRPGTGLGLAICKKIVELHRGRIWVESEIGKGATFYFTLPKTV